MTAPDALLATLATVAPERKVTVLQGYAFNDDDYYQANLCGDEAGADTYEFDPALLPGMDRDKRRGTFRVTVEFWPDEGDAPGASFGELLARAVRP